MIDLSYLPAKTQMVLESCPEAQPGMNDWVFRAAKALHKAKVDPDKMPGILEAAAVKGHRSLREDEVYRAIQRSAPEYMRQRLERKPRSTPLHRVSVNLVEIERVVRSGPRVSRLGDLCESARDVRAMQTEAFIDLLFPGDPLLCAATSLRSFATKAREEWRGFLARRQFIVPSPMSARTGLTQDGNTSARCRANSGPRKYLVVEFDFVDRGDDCDPQSIMLRRLAGDGISVADCCAALHAHLAQYWPLVMVVSSGGKSLHGWYPVEGQPESHVLRFFRFALSLGADPATWRPEQLVRMPEGIRDTGAIQRVLYFNETVIGGNR